MRIDKILYCIASLLFVAMTFAQDETVHGDLTVAEKLKAGIHRVNVANYKGCDWFANGVKIKTSIPFQSGPMPTLIIEGYDYYAGKTVGLSVAWHTWQGNYVNRSAASWGGTTPEVSLAAENGMTTVHLDWLPYCAKLTVSVVGSDTIGDDRDSWFEGWSIVDEVAGTANYTAVEYSQEFRGEVSIVGNVGIGTTSPTNKLDVNGTIRAKEVIVETGWADHVFAPDYQLASLSEVEAHIKANQRLPGVPSAAEIGETGVSLGQSQTMLLEKIEELTLYTIDQEREIEQLKVENLRIEKLDARIVELEALLLKTNL